MLNRKKLQRAARAGVTCASLLLLAACGGSDDPPVSSLPPPIPGTQAVGGVVTGLAGSGLVLQINGGEVLAVAADGGFTFPTPLAEGVAYTVTVRSQPSDPTQICSVSRASGMVGAGPADDMKVVCATQAFAVGGMISGLNGTGLVLRNNAADDLALAVDGPFAFPVPVASGAGYAVTVQAQPAGQVCSVGQATGTVGAGLVTSVVVTCSTQSYTVGGSVSGLVASGLVLQNNGADDVSVVSGASSVTFPTPVAHGASYAVTVATQPVGLTCTVSNGSGAIDGGNVIDVAVACTVDSYRLGLTVSGLDGQDLVLQNNAGDDLAVAADGTHQFDQRLVPGAGYSVTVKSQPRMLTQSCSVTHGSGTMGSADIGNVAVACATATSRFSYWLMPGAQTLQGHVESAGWQAVPGASLALDPDVALLASDPRGRFVFTGMSASGAIRVHPISVAGEIMPVADVKWAASNLAAITLHPDGRALYVSTNDGSMVADFALDDSGVLTSFAGYPLAMVGTGGALAMDPLGRFLYAYHRYGDEIRVFRIGADASISPTAVSTSNLGNAVSMTVHPSGRFLYVLKADGTLEVFAIDATTGGLVTAWSGASGITSPLQVQVHPRGRWLSLVGGAPGSSPAIRAIDPATGAPGPALPPFFTSEEVSSATFDATGDRMLIGTRSPQFMFRFALSPSTGTPLSNTGISAGDVPAAVVVINR